MFKKILTYASISLSLVAIIIILAIVVNMAQPPGITDDSCDMFVFSHAPGFHDDEFELVVTVPDFPNATIHWTIDGTEPTSERPRTIRRNGIDIVVSGSIAPGETLSVYDRSGYWRDGILTGRQGEQRNNAPPAPNAHTLRGSAFRFRAFYRGEAVTGTATATYIIASDVPARFANNLVVSITAPYHDFWRVYGDTHPLANPAERATFNYEFFGVEDGAYSRLFSVIGSTSLGGSGSRGHSQRTFNVHLARDELDGVINHPIFDGVDSLYRFRLWNGGNAFIWDHMRDAFVHSAASGLETVFSQSRVAILFVNGEFWGFTTMREHTNNRFFAQTQLGLNRGNIAIMDSNRRIVRGQRIRYHAVEVGGETAQRLYDELVYFIMAHDLANDSAAVERFFTEFFCRANFIDYLITQTFFHNDDWPQNNLRMFRAIEPQVGNYYADGLWRFMLHDLDFAGRSLFTGSVSPNMNLFAHLLNYNGPGFRNPGPDFSFVFGDLLRNAAFVEEFHARAMYLLENDFATDRLLAHYDEFVQRYLPLLPEMYNRFAVRGAVEDSLANFHRRRADFTRFLTHRHRYYIAQLEGLLSN